MKTMNRAGFTLLEMVVVLGLIALLTHLAVREAGQWRTARLHEAANQGLMAIRRAVLGEEEPTHTATRAYFSGFLADLGRLPRAVTNRQGQLTLAELWTPPDATYAVRAASAVNMVSNQLAEADEEVLLGGGWRGPYLRLPVGKDVLSDAWGNPYETPDSAGYARLLNAASNAVVAGESIILVRHLGADGRPERRRWRLRADAYDAPDEEGEEGVPHERRPRRRVGPEEERDMLWDLHAEPGGLEGLTNATLNVSVTAYRRDGTPWSEGTLPVSVRVYTPQGHLIDVRKVSGSLQGAVFNAKVDGLTPGQRVLRVECNGRKNPPRHIWVQAGERTAVVLEKVVVGD